MTTRLPRPAAISGDPDGLLYPPSGVTALGEPPLQHAHYGVHLVEGSGVRVVSSQMSQVEHQNLLLRNLTLVRFFLRIDVAGARCPSPNGF